MYHTLRVLYHGSNIPGPECLAQQKSLPVPYPGTQIILLKFPGGKPIKNVYIKDTMRILMTPAVRQDGFFCRLAEADNEDSSQEVPG